MEDTLKRLLEAEQRAEELVKQAEVEREAMLRKAEADAQAMEASFRARIPEIRAAFDEKAKAQAEESLSGLKVRHDQLVTHLRDFMEQHEQEAVDAAVALLVPLKED